MESSFTAVHRLLTGVCSPVADHTLLTGVFSPVAEHRLLTGACSPVADHTLLTGVYSPVAEHRLQACGPQQLQHTGSVVAAGSVVARAWAQKLWCSSLVIPWHVESSWTRDRTCVPCIGRETPIYCTAREDPH